MAVLLSLVGAAPASACGPYFPNMLLAGGDNPLLVAPVASFLAEMERLNPGVSSFRARVPTNSYLEQTVDADLMDLRAALEKAAVSGARRDGILQQYESTRAVLAAHAAAMEDWREKRAYNLAMGITNPPPRWTPPAMVAGLPTEFADYLRGAIAWHDGRTNDARAAWQALLARPAADRRYKSTWAAFMIGKSWDDANAEKAIRAFRDVRALAKAGFVDSIGLAASSIGWEARVEYRRKRYEPAMELYLDQLASGDESAVVSLRWAASAALLDRNAPLKKLAANGRCRRVITAWLLSGGNRMGPVDMDGPTKEAMLQLLAKAPLVGGRTANLHTLERPGLLWLEAVESAGIKDAEAAEQFALSAYQCGEMELAQRWIDLAKTSPLSQWLRAKLLLREGKLESAAMQLAQVSRHFPITVPAPPRTNLAANLYVQDGISDSGILVPQQILGELGAVQLARREFTEALDCLLRADFWVDAAYVAERVLTLDELKAYVDRHWGEDSMVMAPETRGYFAPFQHPQGEVLVEPLTSGGRIRYLLGRRLARAHRVAEGRLYYPPGMRPALDRVMAGTAAGTNTALRPDQRAAALWTAAQLTRTFGMELLGTEVEPDWAFHGGDFEEGPDIAARNNPGSVIRASSAELERARHHAADPDVRFHYRYTAAALGWQAAKLMPDNSVETARVLCRAGTWLKYMDPKEADVFYKALVRRCRKTAIGDAADRRRWFPNLDEAGNLAPPATKE